MRNRLARLLVSDGELVKHLPLFVKPGMNVSELMEYIRWQVALNKIPFRQRLLKWRCKRRRRIHTMNGGEQMPRIDVRRYGSGTTDSAGVTWKGTIEPEDFRWIVFVRANGTIMAYNRDPKTLAVVGDPAILD